MKEIKEDKLNEKTSHVHELEDIIVLKCPLCLKQCTDSTVSIKILMTFFSEIEKNYSKIQMTLKETSNSKNNLQKEKDEDYIIPGFKSYYKATVIKTA